MDAFLQLSPSDQRLYCEQAGAHLGMPPSSVEKDFWVCWTLRELFTLSQSGPHLTFKGGTSLSKGWKLIKRFSEDIDLVIDRESLGFSGDKAPHHPGISKNERDRRLKALRAACQEYIGTTLAPELHQRIHDRLASHGWSLRNDPDDHDGETLLFDYPATVTFGSYVAPRVKIELGARSDTEPLENPQIEPYVFTALPGVLSNGSFTVRAVAPERTFWEKVMLLHEETLRAGESGPKARLARHYYDLWCLIHAGIAQKAAANLNLFYRVADHRRIYFEKGKKLQDSLEPGTISLIPVDEQLSSWKLDYEAMRGTMFFGEVPSFDEILRSVGEFQHQFNQQHGSRDDARAGRSPGR